MANCTYCDSFILFGGKADQTGRYCNQTCQQAGNLLALSQQIPARDMADLVQQVHRGECPRCRRPGPIDMHKAHKVWSALILTSWSSSPQLCCKSCAVKRQVGAMLFLGVFGWWGFPWGLVMTPVQVVRNVIEMTSGPQVGQPSPLLQKFVRMQTAAGLVQRARQPRVPAAPPPLPPNDDRYKPESQPET